MVVCGTVQTAAAAYNWAVDILGNGLEEAEGEKVLRERHIR